MAEKKMVIVRGLPGSGKTTMVMNCIKPDDRRNWRICSADHFFLTEDGQYEFKPWLIGMAHEACKVKCVKAMMNGLNVVIDNTNSCYWEYELYELLAKQFNYRLKVIDLFDNDLTDEELFSRCLHGVPLDSITKMRARWEKRS